MKKKFHILFVCSGNICRSPMAEGLLKAKLTPEWQGRVIVQSAGTLFITGIGADLLAIKALEQKGINIAKHRSQGLTPKLVKKADLILLMAESHLEFFAAAEPGIQEKIHLLKTYGKSQSEMATMASATVEDPIGGTFADMQACAEEIETEIDRIWPLIRQEIAQHLKVKISD